MSLILGVDPGQTGAIALLDSDGSLLSVHDMPLLDKKVSVTLLHHLMNDLLPADVSTPIAVIEDVSSSPQMGVTSSFSFGRSKGIVEMAAASFGMRLVYVSPAKWKRDMKLNKDKGKARSLAIQRWPEHAPSFKRVMDDGRAEAALIGLWHLQHGN